MNKHIAVALLFVLVGCDKAPSCKEAVTTALGNMHMHEAEALIGSCEVDGWSPDMRKCVAKATSLDAMAQCGPKSTHAETGRGNPSEASLNLNKIGKAAKRVKGEIGTYPKESAALLPPSSKHCCDAGGACAAKPDAFRADPGWQHLEFEIDEPSKYQYSYTSDGKNFTAYAIGDLDCDGVAATFTMVGTTTAAGNPSINIISPPSGVY